jgi:hypothetical protein
MLRLWIAPVVSLALAVDVSIWQDDGVVQKRWQHAWSSLGITIDDEFDELGSRSAERWFGLGNWYPVDGLRHVACGTLDHWSLYGGLGKELDTHAYFRLNSTTRYLLDDLPIRSRKDVCSEGNGQPGVSCLFGEVTAPDNFTTSQFTVSSSLNEERELTANDVTGNCDETTEPSCKASRYVNQVAACGYGPWIMERVHNWRPEIHPMEMFWAQPDDGATNEVHLVLMQDSSNRFHAAKAFNNGLEGQQWNVWAPVRRTYRVGIAYEASQGQVVQIRIAGITPVSTGSPDTKVSLPAGVPVQILAPDWLVSRAAATHQSFAGPGSTRGLVWLTIPLEHRVREPRPGHAVALSISRVGGTPLEIPRGQAGTSGTQGSPPGENDIGLTLEVIGDSAETPINVTFDQDVPALRNEWGVPAEISGVPLNQWHTSWRHVLTTRVRYLARTPAAVELAEARNRAIENGTGRAIQVRWRFAANAIHFGPPGDGNIAIGQGRRLFTMMIQRWGADKIRTTRDASLFNTGSLKRRGKESQKADAWLTQLVIEFPEGPKGVRFAPVVALSIAADLEEIGGTVRGSTDLYRVLSHSPRVLSKQRTEFPPLLVSLLAVAARPGREQEFQNQLTHDWNLNGLQLATDDAAKRRARILRLLGLAAFEDQDVSAEEFRNLRLAAARYAAAAWPP